MLKRLFWDIETSPNIVLSWRVGWKINIDHDNILQERAIICIGYKWETDKEAKVICWDEQQNDRNMLAEFLNIAEEADELVAHNGDCFDLPWLRTRCAFHRLPCSPLLKTADTLQWAKRKFNFNSNKMDYIAGYLGFGRKLKTEFGLWKDVLLKNDREALARMAEYCRRDVELLEKVWGQLEQQVRHKTHAGVMAGKDKWTCPSCASEHVWVARGPRVTACGTTQHQMQCRKCFRSYSVSSKAHSDFLEAKRKKNGK
jgi:hypothetical protein